VCSPQSEGKPIAKQDLSPTIVRGRRFASPLTRPCAIIVTIPGCWPAWIFVCQALSLTCQEIIYSGSLDAWAQHVRNAFRDVPWFSMTEHGLQNSQFAKNPVWLCLLLSPDLSYLPPGWLSTRQFLAVGLHFQHVLNLSHCSSGGVLQGKWSFSSNRPFARTESELPEVGGSRNSVRQVIQTATPSACKSTMKQVRWRDPLAIAEGADTLLSCDSLLPCETPLMRVKCPSVFSKTGWVVRQLSLVELMSAFDVPTLARPGGPPPKSLWATSDCSFLHNPPLKLLQRCIECWLPTGSPIKYSELKGYPSGNAAGAGPMYSQDARRGEGEAQFAASTKADDAVAFIDMWNDRIWSGVAASSGHREAFNQKFSGRCPLDSLRAACLARWRKNVLRSFLRYVRRKHGAEWEVKVPRNHRDLEVGRQCLRHCAGADWWEWRAGSTLLFWRWPPELQRVARDGHPVWIKGSLPAYRVPQKPERDVARCRQVKLKLENIRQKSYIGRDYIRSLTGYFAVPKGPTDVRMVYDATKSGLNAALWVPSFALPSTETLLDLLDSNSWMGDLDMGEMFLNFPLDVRLRPYCGIDLGPYLDPKKTRGPTWWEAWQRCVMGLVSSPFICTKAASLADEVVRGDPQDPSNPFHWTTVVLNLPGSRHYTPCLPWVYRRRSDGHLASDVTTYVDDMRSVGHSQAACWAVSHCLACWYTWLGIQVTARKTRPPSQTPGAWAGAVVSTGAHGVGVSCSQEKWDKAKGMLHDIQAELSSTGKLLYKPLEQKRGFFIHLQRTYPCITPFLKGFHNTLDGWRVGRDGEGWKLTRRDSTLGFWDETLQRWESFDHAPESPPTQVAPAPRLQSDLNCLITLFSPDTPPTRIVRSNTICYALYGFVDASGSGFGSSIEMPDGST